MIIKQAMSHGLPLPEKIQNAPVLRPGLELYYIAFLDLMASRVTGMGLSPIWWSTVQIYCDAKGPDEFQTFAMHYHIKELDSVFMKHQNKKNPGK